MIGGAHGPQAYLRQVGMGQVLAQWGTETLAARQANDAVARVFRTQAHQLLVAKQADLRASSCCTTPGTSGRRGRTSR